MRGADALIKEGRYSKLVALFFYGTMNLLGDDHKRQMASCAGKVQVGQIAVYRDFSTHSMLSIL